MGEVLFFIYTKTAIMSNDIAPLNGKIEKAVIKSFFLSHREFQGEGSAYPFAALQGNLALITLDDLAHDKKP